MSEPVCKRCRLPVEGPWVPVFDWVPDEMANWNHGIPKNGSQGKIMRKAEVGMVHVTCPPQGPHTSMAEDAERDDD